MAGFQAPPVENRLCCLTPSSDQDIFSLPYQNSKESYECYLKSWNGSTGILPGNCTGFINPLTPRNDSQVTSP